MMMMMTMMIVFCLLTVYGNKATATASFLCRIEYWELSNVSTNISVAILRVNVC
jgi:hypothetical protein